MDSSINNKKSLNLQVASLGPRNIGPFGPSGRLKAVEAQQIIEDLSSDAYSLPATNRWICIDGRCTAKELSDAVSCQTADPQVAGSIPITDTAAAYMDTPETHIKLSQMIAETTKVAISDGLSVVMHGDNSSGKAGCKANAALRDILRFMAENADIIVPQVWSTCTAMGLAEWLSQDDVVNSVLHAKAAVDNDELWDIAPNQVVDIALQNGAEYVELEGAHLEMVDREDWTDRAFAKARFIHDHSTEEQTNEAFSVSLGKYRAETFRRAKLHNESERQAALKTMRAKLFNHSAIKCLVNEDTKVAIVSYS